MQLAQAGRPDVVWIATSHQQWRPNNRTREAASVVGIGDHFAGSREGRVVELDVHQDLRSSSATAVRRSDLSGDGAGGTCMWEALSAREERPGLTISKLRLMRSVGDIRREFDDRSCCKPALTAAAACKEMEAERLGSGEDEPPSGCRGAAESVLVLVLADIAKADEVEEGGGSGSGESGDRGRELRSGIDVSPRGPPSLILFSGAHVPQSVCSVPR